MKKETVGERTHGIHVSTLQRRYNSVTLATQWETEGEFEPTLRAEQIPCVVLGKELLISGSCGYIICLLTTSNFVQLCRITSLLNQKKKERERERFTTPNLGVSPLAHP